MKVPFSFSDWLLHYEATEKLMQLHEGVFDPQAFKAVIMLGGPGTGKSYISDFFRGFKPVNSDSLFEKYLKGSKRIGVGTPAGDDVSIPSRAKFAQDGVPNAGDPQQKWTGQSQTPPEQTPLVPTDNKITQNMDAPTWSPEELPAGPNGERGYNLGQWPDEEPHRLARGIDIGDDNRMRQMKKRAGIYTNTMAGIKAPGIDPGKFDPQGTEGAPNLGAFDDEGERRTDQLGFEPHPFRGNPLILETTGQNLDSLTEDLPALKGLGYDVYGVMVNCLHIDSALRSNFERGKSGRSLRDGLVVKIHREVQKNLKDIEDGYRKKGRGFFRINVDRTPPPGYTWLKDDELDAAMNVTDPEAWAKIVARKGLYDEGAKWKFGNSAGEIGNAVSTIQGKTLKNPIGLEWLQRERIEALKDAQVSDHPEYPTPGTAYRAKKDAPKRLPPWQGGNGQPFRRPPV